MIGVSHEYTRYFFSMNSLSGFITHPTLMAEIFLLHFHSKHDILRGNGVSLTLGTVRVRVDKPSASYASLIYTQKNPSSNWNHYDSPHGPQHDAIIVILEL